MSHPRRRKCHVRWTGLRLAALPSAPGTRRADAVLPSRQRSCLGDDRQRFYFEGLFWESVNAIGVLKSPAVLTIYDDGYGISVPNQFQMVKENIGSILKGFERDAELPAEMASAVSTCTRCAPGITRAGRDLRRRCRDRAQVPRPRAGARHRGTQPLGHSTSGSHERYKSAERLEWELQFDCLRKMREWVLANDIATEKELAAWKPTTATRWKTSARPPGRRISRPSWPSASNCSKSWMRWYRSPSIRPNCADTEWAFCASQPDPADMHVAVHEALGALRDDPQPAVEKLKAWKQADEALNEQRYGSHLQTVLRSK